MNHNAAVAIQSAKSGTDYDVEKDRATGRKLYIPVVIDEGGGRHRLEQLGYRKAQDTLDTASAAREEVLAKLKVEQAIEDAQRQADVDAAVLAAVGE